MIRKANLLTGILVLALSLSALAGNESVATTALQIPAAQPALSTQLHPSLDCHRRNSYYRSSYNNNYRRAPRSSKLRTALTIAAPAALGAGVGAWAGGKKGAGVGALLGGGGGALYHLFKSRQPRY